jgi:hypothetical protein
MLHSDPYLLDVLRSSHTAVCRIQVFRLELAPALLPGTSAPYRPVYVQDLQVVEGSVTADREANARRTIECTVIADPGTDIELNIVDRLIHVQVGVQVGHIELLVPAGVFRVDSLTRGPMSALQVVGSSFESYLADTSFYATGAVGPAGDDITGGLPTRVPLQPSYSAGGSLNVVNEIERLIRLGIPFHVDIDRDPSLGPVLASTYPDEYSINHQDNVWEKIQILADSINAQVYANAYGRIVIDTIKRIDHVSPSLFIHEGADGVLVSASVSTTRDDLYNGVYVLGVNSDNAKEDVGSEGDDQIELLPQIAAYATDVHPDSATRWTGPFGKKMMFAEPNAGLTSNATAIEKARTLLIEHRAVSRELDMSALPNPLLEPDDVIAVSMVDGTVESHMVSSVAIPLDGSSWSVSTLASRTNIRNLVGTYDFFRVALLLYGTYDQAAVKWTTYDAAVNSVYLS